MLGTVFDVFINKCDVIVEIILIRYNVVRLFNCIILDVQFAIGATYSGVMLLSTGFNLDIRLDCTIYTRCSITTCVGGISSCSIVRLLLRLEITQLSTLSNKTIETINQVKHITNEATKIYHNPHVKIMYSKPTTL
jgi:NADH:ubiquinone oxidoreductase subunit D